MSIRGRIAKLEGKAAARPRDCPGCGYPSRMVVRVIETDHEDPLPTCTACGRTLDYDGMPLGDRYKWYICIDEPAIC